MPFPSAGCQTCKLRRVKCDEAQPVCGKCKKAQRVCYGVRAGSGCSVIHIENSYASGHSKRPRGPRSTRIAEPHASLAILQLPDTDLKTRAITYYFHHHLYSFRDAHDLSKSVGDDFLATWSSRPESTILNLAGSCMALAVFSRTQRLPSAAIEASMKYQRLLQLTQKTIPSLSDENIEICLLAIFFMGRYEEAIYCPSHGMPKISPSSKLRSFRHHDGASSILKVWTDQQRHKHPPTDIIRHCRRGLIRSALLRNAKIPEWMLDGPIFGEHGLELQYDLIITRIVNLRHRLATILKERTSSLQATDKLTPIVEELNNKAQEIDRALQDWADHFPTTWGYQRHTLPVPHPWPMRDFYSSIVYSYRSPAFAAIWNMYYSMRMLVNSTRLKILDLTEPTTASMDEQRSECFSLLTEMADDLASSIPFCLGRFKVVNDSALWSNETSITLNTNEEVKPSMAMLIVWPLSLVASIGGVESKQKVWFKSELARLGRLLGYGLIESAETDQWPVNNLNFDSIVE